MSLICSRTLLALSSFCGSLKKCPKHRHAAASTNVYKVLFAALLLQLLLGIAAGGALTAAHGGTKGLPRMRSSKIAHLHNHGLQSVPPESFNGGSNGKNSVRQSGATADRNHLTGKYEIRSVSGEPNYKSVNLTWEVEFVPSAALTDSSSSSSASSPPTTDIDAITNSSAEVEPPKAFQIFFCELQSFGPHRCRSKLVNQSQQLEPNDGYDGYDYNNGVVEVNDSSGGNDDSGNSNNKNDNNKQNKNSKIEQAKSGSRQIRQYSVQIDNLRMATKYSFHIRPQAKRRNMKITGRAELFGNEIDNGATTSMSSALKGGVPLDGGKTIIIPTKGFSAQATKCLPHASEIEVETGPYFGGKIVVDGGNCALKGNQDDPIDRYTMRIDHKMCGSLVKPETNTVETFITVQENVGIYTHSTRRFVVVCSFQSGMQTVRASFTVPGSDGVASAVENDPFEPDGRLGREQRFMRYVDKSGLVLKEHLPLHEPVVPAAYQQAMSAEESAAQVQEVTDADVNDISKERDNGSRNSDDVPNSVALVEDILPGVNEQRIKHERVDENEGLKLLEISEQSEENLVPAAANRAAKYAKLVIDEDNADGLLGVDQWQHLNNRAEERGLNTSLEQISSNVSNIILTVALSAIVLSVFVFVVLREMRRQHYRRSNIKMQQLETSRPASSPNSSTSEKSTSSGKRAVTRAMQEGQQQQHAQRNMQKH